MNILNLDKIFLPIINTFGVLIIGIAILILIFKVFKRSQMFDFDKYDWCLFILVLGFILFYTLKSLF